MSKQFNNPPETVARKLMVQAAKQGLHALGYSFARVPGRGLSSIWTITKNGKSQKAAIRTTRNRWFAFPPLAEGAKWKTLSDVEVVILAAVDSRDEPRNVEVYLLPAEDVRKHFDLAYVARTGAGWSIKDDFGMWISLDLDDRPTPSSAGSGIVNKHKPIAVYAVEELVAASPEGIGERDLDEEDEADTAPAPSTIAEVMEWARQRVAAIAGVRIENVKLDLRVEY